MSYIASIYLFSCNTVESHSFESFVFFTLNYHKYEAKAVNYSINIHRNYYFQNFKSTHEFWVIKTNVLGALKRCFFKAPRTYVLDRKLLK